MNRPVFLLILPLLLSGCGKKESGPSTPPPVPVEVATVEARSIPVEMLTIGTVEPMATVQLKSKVSGEILKVLFADGAQVEAGEVLFQIDPRPFDAALKRAAANLAITQSTLSNANEQAERYTTLIKRGVASKEQFSQYLSTAESQKAELEARQADVDQAKLSLDWTQVQAPISGRAGAALLKAGNIVLANTEVLTVINQMQPIYVAFSLPESSLATIRQWMSKEKPVVTARHPDTGEVLSTGELTFIDNAVNTTSGMIAMKAVFKNENQRLWPGQFVDVTVTLGHEDNSLVIPSVAIMEGQQGPQVFIVEGETASLRPVKTYRTSGDMTLISEGVAEGETVITVGQLRVANGAKVAPKAAPNPTPAQ